MNYSRILHPDPRISKPTNLPQRLMSCLNYQPGEMPLFAVFPQDKEQMTTGIYTTKWFLQCFIDRVRMLWGFFAALLFACMIIYLCFF